MPGPQEIAEGRLLAEFGFEAQEGVNELVLEIVERDRKRMEWSAASNSSKFARMIASR